MAFEDIKKNKKTYIPVYRVSAQLKIRRGGRNVNKRLKVEHIICVWALMKYLIKPVINKSRKRSQFPRCAAILWRNKICFTVRSVAVRCARAGRATTLEHWSTRARTTGWHWHWHSFNSVPNYKYSLKICLCEIWGIT